MAGSSRGSSEGGDWDPGCHPRGPQGWRWGLEVAVGGCEIPGVEETPRNDGIEVTRVALGTQR